VDRREEEGENSQKEEHGWVLKGTRGSTGRRIRGSARPGTEWGGGAGGSARAAWRPTGPLPDVEGGETASAGTEGGGRKRSSTRGAGRRRAQCGGRGGCTSGGAEGKQSRGGSGARRKKRGGMKLRTDLQFQRKAGTSLKRTCNF
jgi:hypothetical protein